MKLFRLTQSHVCPFWSFSDPTRLVAIQQREIVLGQVVLDFAMARCGLGINRPQIAAPLMLRNVSNQYATSLLELSEERCSLHATAISATLRIPCNSSLEVVRCL